MNAKLPLESMRPFLAMIASNPDDVAPRLVFADWLEENECGYVAQFIRAHIGYCSLCKTSDYPRTINKSATHWYLPREASADAEEAWRTANRLSPYAMNLFRSIEKQAVPQIGWEQHEYPFICSAGELPARWYNGFPELLVYSNAMRMRPIGPSADAALKVIMEKLLPIMPYKTLVIPNVAGSRDVAMARIISANNPQGRSIQFLRLRNVDYAFQDNWERDDVPSVINEMQEVPTENNTSCLVNVVSADVRDRQVRESTQIYYRLGRRRLECHRAVVLPLEDFREFKDLFRGPCSVRESVASRSYFVRSILPYFSPSLMSTNETETKKNVRYHERAINITAHIHKMKPANYPETHQRRIDTDNFFHTLLFYIQGEVSKYGPRANCYAAKSAYQNGAFVIGDAVAQFVVRTPPSSLLVTLEQLPYKFL
jgi:uncharacterized protein (TIGR02996 family)